VERLAAQRRPVVFPFHRDPDGAGHAERLCVVLLRYHTWRERERERESQDEMMEGKKAVGVAANILLPFPLLGHHTTGRRKKRHLEESTYVDGRSQQTERKKKLVAEE